MGSVCRWPQGEDTWAGATQCDSPPLAASEPRGPSSGPLCPALASSLGVLSISPRKPGGQEGEGRARQPVTLSLWSRDGATVASGLCTPARLWLL